MTLERLAETAVTSFGFQQWDHQQLIFSLHLLADPFDIIPKTSSASASPHFNDELSLLPSISEPANPLRSILVFDDTDNKIHISLGWKLCLSNGIPHI
jgi:hypothetical protein